MSRQDRVQSITMDVKSFYKRKKQGRENGSSAGARKSCLSRLLHTKRQLDPDTLWKVFPKQQMAFNFARTCWQSAVVFAFESEDFGHEGQRKYLVTTYHHFSQKYLAMEPPRHFYEVITEGTVCRLYFDIEYKLELNAGVPAIPTLETFIEYVCYQLSACFQLSCSRSQVLDLDSTTDTKFSRHLIFHLANAVFTNNIHIGNWVHYICDKLRGLRREIERGVDTSEVWRSLFSPCPPSPCPTVERLLKLFVANDKGDLTLFCDEGVYTRNRNFRLFLSSKLGKMSCLRLAKENRFKTVRRKDMQKKRYLVDVFLDSLICNVSYETSPRIISFESCGEEGGGGGGGGGRRKRRKREGTVEVPSASSGLEGYSTSPHPLVDSFITSSCINRGGVQGVIRRWSYFQQERLLVYDIKHNRWCYNIERAHKSNNIMIVADLQRGVYYQKCHDPICRGINFKSNEFEIPNEVNPFSVGVVSGEGGSEEDVGQWLGPGDLPLEQLQVYTLEEEGEERKKEEGVKGERAGGGEEEEQEKEEGGWQDHRLGNEGVSGDGLHDEAILARVAEEMDLNFPTDDETVPPAPKDLSGQSVADHSAGHSPLLSSQEEDLLFDAAYDAYDLA